MRPSLGLAILLMATCLLCTACAAQIGGEIDKQAPVQVRVYSYKEASQGRNSQNQEPGEITVQVLDNEISRVEDLRQINDILARSLEQKADAAAVDSFLHTSYALSYDFYNPENDTVYSFLDPFGLLAVQRSGRAAEYYVAVDFDAAGDIYEKYANNK